MNISTGIRFIHAWLEGKGQFVFESSLENAASGEISRAQIWQWIRHRSQLEEDNTYITRKMILYMVEEFARHNVKSETMSTAIDIFKQLVTSRTPPEYISEYLNNEHAFISRHYP